MLYTSLISRLGMEQTTDTILLVRPHRFRKNEQTAVNNYFQEDSSLENINASALREFDNFIRLLNQHKVNVFVVQDDGRNDTPDSIFPNNCISFHKRTVVLYPMFAENRRLERQLNILQHLEQWGLTFDDVVDYTRYEDEGRFLEGTGSLVLDRKHRMAYCSLSPRAEAGLVHEFCLDLGFTPFLFEATQTVGDIRLPIYHTNVMMSIGSRFAVVCLESLDNLYYQDLLVNQLQQAGKQIIAISEEQMQHFAGNILEIKSTDGQPLIVMSSQAYNAFTQQQLSKLSTYGEVLHAPLDTIETCGGGSARCMIAEVFY